MLDAFDINDASRAKGPDTAFKMIDTFEKYVSPCCQIMARVNSQKEAVFKIEKGEMFVSGSKRIALDSNDTSTPVEWSCFLIKNIEIPLINVIEIVRKSKNPPTFTDPSLEFEYKNRNIFNNCIRKMVDLGINGRRKSIEK